MSAIAFSRSIGPVALDVVLTEKHESELEIARNPVEMGAEITDHAYMAPRVLIMEVADQSATQAWQALKRLQESRVPFTVVSGLDVYDNLLVRRMSAERDIRFSTILRATIELQEVILVSTGQASASDASGQQKSQKGGKANPGGKDSRRAATPSSGRASDQASKDRASSTVQRGDAASKPLGADSGSLLYQAFGGG